MAEQASRLPSESALSHGDTLKLSAADVNAAAVPVIAIVELDVELTGLDERNRPGRCSVLTDTGCALVIRTTSFLRIISSFWWDVVFWRKIDSSGRGWRSARQFRRQMHRFCLPSSWHSPQYSGLPEPCMPPIVLTVSCRGCIRRPQAGRKGQSHLRPIGDQRTSPSVSAVRWFDYELTENWSSVESNLDLTFRPDQDKVRENNTVHAGTMPKERPFPAVIILDILDGSQVVSRRIDGAGHERHRRALRQMPYYGPRRPAGGQSAADLAGHQPYDGRDSAGVLDNRARVAVAIKSARRKLITGPASAAS